MADSSVVDEIAAERRRQIEAEGWTPEHDDNHRNGEMALAAASYAREAANDAAHGAALGFASYSQAPRDWPWDSKWFKPKNRRRDLIRAAALIVAEIERLDRAQRERQS